MSFDPSDKIGGLSEDELVAFLAAPWNARIATVTRDGWPHVTPVWYEFDLKTRSFLVVGRERAAWVAHIRDNSRAAFHVADDGIHSTRACSSRRAPRSWKARSLPPGVHGCWN